MRLTTVRYLDFTKSLIHKVGSLTFIDSREVTENYLKIKLEYTEKFKEVNRKTNSVKNSNSRKEDSDINSEEDQQIESSKNSTQDTPLVKFWKYFEKNYLSLIVNQVLNYSNLEQKYRSNSIVERYHSLLQQKIPKKPNWPLFLKKLIEEEAEIQKL